MDNKKLTSGMGGGRGWRALFTLLALIIWSGWYPAFADNIQYTYDELGRLVQASNLTSGQAVVYTYDGAGNITSQNVVALGTLSIAYFSPNHGPAGTAVTISGTGFSSTAGSNVVSFNGTTASVANASTTQLVVTVPAGASTGPISVQVGASSVTSSGPFTVTSSADGPSITGLFPTIGAPGQLVTLTGVNFETTPNSNRVRFDETPSLVTASTSTSINTSVPAGSGSGKVRLTTPRGTAVSPMDFIVVPSGYTAGSIGSTGRLPTDGSSATVSLPTASKVSVQLFDGNAGDLLTLGVTSTSVASAAIKVFKPDGTSLTTGTVTASGQGVQLPKLPVNGTYTIVVDPGSNTGSLALSLVKPFLGALTLDGTPTPVTLAPPGRRALLTFSGTQGTYANLSLNGVTVSAGTVTIFGPDGGPVDSRTFTTAGTTLQPQLPLTGTYTVLIDPTGSVGGSMSVSLTTSSSPTLGVNGNTYSLALTNTNPVSITFQGTEGQILALAASTSQTTVTSFSLTINSPDGTQVAAGTLNTTSGSSGNAGSVVINTGPLVIGGTYTVIVKSNVAGNATVALTLSSPITGTLTTDGPTAANSIGTPGQGLLFTAPAVAGQYLSFALVEDINNLGRINGAAVTVFRPDGSYLTSGTLATAFQTCSSGTCLGTSGYYGSTVVNTGPLPVTGNYTFLVQQTGTGSLDTGTLYATVSTPQTSGPALNGGSYNASISRPGQGLFYTLNATAGQYLSVGVNEGVGQIDAATVVIYGPDGTLISAGNFGTTAHFNSLALDGYTGSAVVNAGPLPTSGPYTVLIQQAGSGKADTGTLSVTLATPMPGVLTANSGTANAVIQAPGQGLLYTFNGTAGQFVALNVGESNDQIGSAKVSLLKPDGTSLATGAFATTAVTGTLGGVTGYQGTLVVNAGPLPSSGTYSLLIQQTGVGTANTGTLSLTLSTPLTGTLTANGASTGVGISAPGQAVQYSFTGSAGQIVAVSAQVNNDQINAATVAVVKPDGTTIASGTLTTTAVRSALGAITGYSGGLVLNAGPLPIAGTYSVLVQQSGTGLSNTGTVNLTLSSPVTGASLPVGGSANVAVSLPGQGFQPVFTASAGQYMTVQVAESAGSNVSSALVTVLNPDGSRLKAQAMSASTCQSCNGYTGSTTLNLGPVPQTGTYAVLAQQTSLAASGTGTLTFSLNQASTPAGSSSNLSSPGAGQMVNYTFSATAGESIGLAITSLVFTPSYTGYLSFTVYNPDGSYYNGYNCYSASPGCQFSLLNLTQSGTYTIKFSPPTSSEQMSFTVNVTPDTSAALTVGPAQPVTLGTLSQNALLQFTATANQTLALTLSGVATIPANTTVTAYIYNSAGSQVTNVSTQGTVTLNLASLPADTYTVLITPQYPITGSLNVGLVAGTTGTVPSNGTSTSVATQVPGENAYLSFSATAGQSLGLAMTGTTFSPAYTGYVSFTIYKPDGSYYNGYNCYSASPGCQFSLLNLPQTGTYTVTLTPPTNSEQMSFNVIITPDLTGTLPLDSPQTVNLTTPGQNELLTFTTTPNQTVALRLSGVATTPANTSVTAYIYNSAGSQVTNISATSAAILNLVNMAADTYTVLITPQYPVTASLQVSLVTGVTGTATVDGSSSMFTTQTPGANTYFSFSAKAGQSISIAMNGVSFTPTYTGYVSFTIYKPDGSYYNGYNCYSANPGCEFSLLNLPQSGMYSVVATPPTSSEQMTFTVTMVQDLTATLAVNTPKPVALTTLGQNALLTFTATAGQTYALNLSNIATTPANTSVSMYVYNSAGSQVYSTSTTSWATVNMPGLPADNYTVLITPQYPVTANVQVTLFAGTTGVIPTNGNAQSFATIVPGQNAYLSFSATAGQSLSMALTNVSFTPSYTGYVSFTIYKPDGSYYNGYNCYSANPGCEFSLLNLPQTGSYSVVFTPPTATEQMSFSALIVPDSTGTLTAGSPQTVSLPVLGQNTLLTFTATAGQTFALNLSGVTTSPANTTVYAYIYNSSWSQVTSTSTASNITLNLPNLAAGTYTVLITPQYPVTGSLQVTLDPGTIGTIPNDGTSQTFSTVAPGQNAYLSFSGTAGQSLSMALTNLVFTPSYTGYVSFTIYNPNGSYYNGYNCNSANPGCEFSLPNLPQTGVYSVVFTPPTGSEQMSFAASFIPDVTGTLTAGSPQTISLATLGQNAVLTFTATAGQTFALNMSGVSTTPANTTVYAYLYNSSWSQVNSFSTTTAATLNLANLAAGTYYVLVTPQYPVTGSVQVALQPGTTGTIPTDGTSQTFSTVAAGQNAYLTFSASAGQSLSLALSNLSFTPSYTGYMSFTIYNPNGSYYNGYNCYSGNPGCEISLRNLPQTGSYSIIFTPPTGSEQMSFVTTMASDVSGTLTSGTPATVNLATLGQNAVLTFTTTATQTVTVSASGITTTPANTSVSLYIYNSGGSQVGSSSGTASSTATLTNLAAGTYTVLVTPQYPITGSLQVSYH